MSDDTVTSPRGRCGVALQAAGANVVLIFPPLMNLRPILRRNIGIGGNATANGNAGSNGAGALSRVSADAPDEKHG
ncbi:hypothetical protein SYNPS1DRAFT_24133 [Syncephalis pseudoplumigaleata]|uniref:Uncharacterized protein n=1 Tax=Syncephalis pseudoplumigaleata TaxID=1712513 RepID=A0A4P9YVF6_9FUNG|nr:hypothetical protein SYNPS1DRAFT_24133 [Syncephalis pseudoplumigaleata]|eukprot:RKP23788.1 hypothetical protein SYNPS1DRAFT_24133 [Syncephalis pseudoplumigaleata]